MDVSEAQRLRALEEETRQLNTSFANLSLDVQIPQTVAKNGWPEASGAVRSNGSKRSS